MQRTMQCVTMPRNSIGCNMFVLTNKTDTLLCMRWLASSKQHLSEQQIECRGRSRYEARSPSAETGAAGMQCTGTETMAMGVG